MFQVGPRRKHHSGIALTGFGHPGRAAPPLLHQGSQRVQRGARQPTLHPNQVGIRAGFGDLLDVDDLSSIWSLVLAQLELYVETRLIQHQGPRYQRMPHRGRQRPKDRVAVFSGELDPHSGVAHVQRTRTARVEQAARVQLIAYRRRFDVRVHLTGFLAGVLAGGTEERGA